MLNQGSLLALTGRASEAIENLTCWISGGYATAAAMPLYLARLARAHAVLGQFEEAWRCVGDARLRQAELRKETRPDVPRFAQLSQEGKISLYPASAGREELASRFRQCEAACRAIEEPRTEFCFDQAYEIVKVVMDRVSIYPANTQERTEALEIDELDRGWPRMSRPAAPWLFRPRHC